MGVARAAMMSEADQARRITEGFHIPSLTLVSAEADARRHMLRELVARLPDPAEYAFRLPLAAVEALTGAWRSQDPDNPGCWRVSEEAAPLLRSLGLVEVRGVHLGAFGIAVRRVVMEQQQ